MACKALTVLRERNLLGKEGPNASAVSSLSLSNLVEVAQEIEDVIRSEHRPVKNPIFSHSASLGLGGSRLECANLDCRISRINELARFALMYSDKVFISSFLSDYKHIEHNEELELAKEQFYEDLFVLYKIRHLLERGYIRFFAPETDICFSCQAKEFLGDKAGKKFDKEYRILQKSYLNKMSVSCEMEEDIYGFSCDGPYPYFDHERIRVHREVPHEISTRPRIMSRIRKGDPVPLSKRLIRELSFHTDLSHQIAQNAIHGLATSTCLNTTFVTEHDLHISFLNSLHPSPEIRRRNYMALNYLSSMVPFVEDVAIADIIKLRQREEEAFLAYRKALNVAIDNFSRFDKSFTVRDAESLYADVISPSLASLDQKVNQAKRDLVKKPFRSLTGIVGVISFGILTGLVPADISAIATAIGLVKFGADLVQQTMALGDKENAIKGDQFYFLWKVKKKAK